MSSDKKINLCDAVNAYRKSGAVTPSQGSLISKQIFSKDDFTCSSENESSFISLLPLITSEVKSDKALHSMFLEALSHTKGKLLFMICGPSSVGKDTISSSSKICLMSKGIDVSFIKKYTTRSERKSSEAYEPSGTYEYFRSEKKMRENKNDIAVPYKLYDSFYALSGNHLMSSEKNLLCIYGDIIQLPKVKREIFYKYNRIPVPLLLTADPKHLEGRLLNRPSIPDKEKITRLKTLKVQCDFIKNNPNMVNNEFHQTLSNGNYDRLGENSDTLEKIIITFTESCKELY